MESTRKGIAAVFHGGRSFEAIGEDLRHLDRARQIVRADVLDAWFPPSPRVLQRLREHLPFLTSASPPTHAAGLVASIAKSRDLCAELILAGGGSSDLIFSCLPRLIARGESALILDPTYGEYVHVLRDLVGARVSRFALHRTSGFRVDTSLLCARVRESGPRLVVIVNPNSPTGQYWPKRELLQMIGELPRGTSVLVDETYIEYVDPRGSVEREASTRRNLLVMKSMSKVYALSGLRVGYLVGHPDVIRGLRPWLPPWGVSLPAQMAAIEALQDPGYYQARYIETGHYRRELIRMLRRNPDLAVYDSDINMVLIETPSSAAWVVREMERAGVYVRNCDSMSEHASDRLIRIAVKDLETNQRTYSALSAAIAMPSEAA
jgi:histidinol-phosphate/aromatic aminotransferase/cobyric acid decarboxylase-like protein